MVIINGFIISYAVIFGLIAAIGWGIGPVLSKYAYTSDATPITATSMQVIIGVVVLWSITFLLYGARPLYTTQVSELWPFIVGGVIGGGVARYCLYWGIDTIGASITSAVGAADPIFAVLIAAIALSEIPSNIQVLGVVITMIGVVTVSISNGGNRTGWRAHFIVIPLTAAFLYGVAAVLRRYGFSITDLPVFFVVSVSETVALLTVLCIAVGRAYNSDIHVPVNGFKYLLGSGIAYTVGTVSIFASLNSGPVVIGATLGSTAAVVNVVVVSVFLQQVERVPLQTVVGTVIGVCGVILVAL